MIYFEGIATFSKLQSVSFFAQLRSITREIEQYGIGIVFNTGHWDYNSSYYKRVVFIDRSPAVCYTVWDAVDW